MTNSSHKQNDTAAPNVFLHLAIEVLIDMGNYVVADDDLPVVNWYSDIPKLLKDHKLISRALCDKWIQMIGFRNTLVYEYIDNEFDPISFLLYAYLLIVPISCFHIFVLS